MNKKEQILRKVIREEAQKLNEQDATQISFQEIINSQLSEGDFLLRYGADGALSEGQKKAAKEKVLNAIRGSFLGSLDVKFEELGSYGGDHIMDVRVPERSIEAESLKTVLNNRFFSL